MRRTLGVLLCAALGAAVPALALLRTSAGDLRMMAEDKYRALFQVRRDALRAYLASVVEETRFWNKNRLMREALVEFSAAWRELDEPEAMLRALYIDDNPYPPGEKDNLENAGDGSRYSAAHARYHFWLRSFLAHRGVYDVFLFDPDGNLVYTAFKERDFATNVVRGPWSESALGAAFASARDNPFPSHVSFFDFAPYGPSADAPASFAASAVLDEDGEFLGALAFQIPAERIDEIMQVRAGMGDTGETYAVGADGLMRSGSRFSETSTVLQTRVDTDAAQRALAGETGFAQIDDYRGVPVLSAFGPLEFEGLRWAVLAEVDVAEVEAPVRSLRSAAAGWGLGGFLLGALVGLSTLRPKAAS